MSVAEAHAQATSVGADLPRQMARVARLAIECVDLPHHGKAIDVMLAAIERAAEAIANQDLYEMMRSHQLLAGFRL